MKNTINISKLFLAVAIIFTLVSCKKDKTTPDNEITDGSGIRVLLKYNTGGTDQDALSACDLDLYLFNGNTQVRSSTSGIAFDYVDVTSSDPDAEYTIKVKYFSGSANPTISLVTTGKGSNPKSYTVTGSLTASQNGATISFAKLKKSGNTYTITKL